MKTNSGITKRVSINDLVLQGTLWSGLMCTCQMDKLAKSAYENNNTYLYRGKEPVPPLEMVDDILVISECGQDSVVLNSKVNSFIESKKLKLSSTKCHKMHIGKMTPNCPTLKVHDKDMESTDKEKYLGDILVNNGKILKTIEDRQAKGFGLVTQALAILAEIPLGRYKIQMGLHLRQAMLINGMLFNSEAWHSVNKYHIEMLEKVDHLFLRQMFNSHSKTSIPFLHLETGTVPITFIVSSRRLNYLHNILKRNDTEVLKRVYKTQKESPLDGDFVKLVENDFTTINEKFDENFIKSLSKAKMKKYIKQNIHEASFKYLLNEQSSKSKIKNIKYKKFKLQKYMTSNIFSNYEVEVLSKFRSRNINVKSNFKKQFTFNNIENLQCSLNNCFEEETQEHLMKCKPIIDQLHKK